MQEKEKIINFIDEKLNHNDDFSILKQEPENCKQIICSFLSELKSNDFIKYISDLPNLSKRQGEAIFLEAPTGSGKDRLFLQLSLEHPEKRYVELNMDMFRNKYKFFIKDLKELNDIDFAKATNEFSYELFILIQEILLKYYPGTNVVITGTLREKEWNEQLMRRYKQDDKTNYSIKLITLAISIKEGLYSIIERYVRIVESKRNKGSSSKGDARYTSSEYFYETNEKFKRNFEEFVSLYKKAPGELIDSIEIYKRKRFTHDRNLVYVLNKENGESRDPISIIDWLRNQEYNIPLNDAKEVLDLIKTNSEYLMEQNTYRDIVETLAVLLNYRRKTPIESLANRLTESLDDNRTDNLEAYQQWK